MGCLFELYLAQTFDGIMVKSKTCFTPFSVFIYMLGLSKSVCAFSGRKKGRGKQDFLRHTGPAGDEYHYVFSLQTGHGG